ncbi:MAG: hypothetical protein JSR77_11090 [Planctomycetes bacterium]|nr:hypothetical protein [Planctomycetota bacterium]
MNRHAPRFLLALCSLLALLALPDAALAVFRGFSSHGTAQFTSGATFVGRGNATHLGRYTEAGTISFAPTSDPAVLHVEGAIVYTSTQNDQLHAAFSGQLNLQTGAITATITYVAGGTGRFVNAGGSSILTGQLGPDGITVSVQGTINY